MPEPQIVVVDNGPRRVSRAVTVQAPATLLFGMVADPYRHPELDGSGTVRRCIAGPQRLSSGSTFTMKMKMFGLPYWVTNRVTRFEDNRLIEWAHLMKHRWRWEFTEITSGTTQIVETYDYTTSIWPSPLDEVRAPRMNAEGITATLTRLAMRFPPEPASG